MLPSSTEIEQQSHIQEYLNLVHQKETELNRHLRTQIDFSKQAFRPPHDRARIEYDRRHNIPEVAIGMFLIEVRNNVITHVSERLKANCNPGYLTVTEEGRLQTESGTDFVGMLETGLAYIQQHQVNCAREQIEIQTWREINKFFGDKDTAVGARILIFSPPSTKEGTPYIYNFIDELTLEEKDGKKVVKRQRHLVNFDSYDQYIKFAQQLQPDFLDGFDENQNFDIWALGHPIETYEPIPQEIKRGLKNEDFNLIISHCQTLIDVYIRLISSKSIDWLNLVNVSNTIIKKADKLYLDWAADKLSAPRIQTRLSDSETMQLIHREIFLLSNQAIRNIQTGCAISGGIKTSNALTDLASANSVLQFSQKESWEYHTGKCKSCGSEPASVGPCDICTNCEQKPELL